MNELSHHIKVLLLTHDHVTLPQFGTFFADSVATGYVGDDLFAPHRSRLLFTSEIDEADNSLTESFMRTYNIGKQEAEKKIESLVVKASNTLAATGALDFDTLGTFYFTGGRITFSPCMAGLVIPDYYGLDAFAMPLLPKLAANDATQITNAIRTNTTNNQYVIRLNRQFVHYVASVAAAIMFFFIFNIPTGDTTTITPDQKSMFGMFIPHINNSHLSIVEEPEAIVENKMSNSGDKNIDSGIADNTTEIAADNTETCASTNIKPANETSKPYTIVLASDVSRRGAEDFICQLAKSGFNDANVYDKSGMIRVIYSLYLSQQEAYSALYKLRKEDRRFNDAWVMKIIDEKNQMP